MDRELSFPKNKIKILLLEGIHDVAVERLRESGYAVESNPKSLTAEELLDVIPDVHVLGIRSKTKVNSQHFTAARRLLAVGCFGVGTNQVDLDAAAGSAVPVFNAPYGNTRSVAELTIADVIFLARRAADKNCKMHNGIWSKSAKGAREVRDKVIGIVGYGHIGQQVGLLAEAVGMRVLFFDMSKRLPLGTAKLAESFDALLAESDFVTLHVPAMPNNRPLISRDEIAKMKDRSYLLNLSRGSLIDFTAVKEAVESGKLAGAAVDVYPAEPKGNNEPFACELAGVENVILTPHLGGSTEEAQYNIALEVSAAFVKLIDSGCTFGAVNFPQVDLPFCPESHRILNVHRNEPGVLSAVNKIIADLGANINAQYLSTYKNIGYLVMDVNKAVSEEVKEQIAALATSIRTRILY
jgi:D-3-phosphoglycerate dehydrogenase